MGLRRVTVTYTPSEGGWIASASDPEATVFGRTIEKARENAAEALSRSLRTFPSDVAIHDEVQISKQSQLAVEGSKAARNAALKAEAESAAATLSAARRLHADGLSLRDIAYLLGVSHSRVHQILGKDTRT